MTKLGYLFIGFELLAMLFVGLTSPEYDGNDLSALMFWLFYFHVFLIVGCAILLIQMLRWLARQGWRR